MFKKGAISSRPCPTPFPQFLQQDGYTPLKLLNRIENNAKIYIR